MTIQNNSVVSLEYKLTDDDNNVLDTTKDREIFKYIHGNGMIIPGLEKALEGRTSGDEFEVTVQPEEAYGAFQPEYVQAVPREQFPKEPEVQPGMQFEIQSDQMSRVVTVTEVSDSEVTIDANHPLAGKTLHFDVQVVEVREASDEELNHGHVHE